MDALGTTCHDHFKKEVRYVLLLKTVTPIEIGSTYRELALIYMYMYMLQIQYDRYYIHFLNNVTGKNNLKSVDFLFISFILLMQTINIFVFRFTYWSPTAIIKKLRFFFLKTNIRPGPASRHIFQVNNSHSESGRSWRCNI